MIMTDKKVFDLTQMLPKEQHLALIDSGFKFTPSGFEYNKYNTTIRIKNNNLYLQIGFNEQNERKIASFSDLMVILKERKIA